MYVVNRGDDFSQWRKLREFNVALNHPWRGKNGVVFEDWPVATANPGRCIKRFIIGFSISENCRIRPTVNDWNLELSAHLMPTGFDLKSLIILRVCRVGCPVRCPGAPGCSNKRTAGWPAAIRSRLPWIPAQPPGNGPGILGVRFLLVQNNRMVNTL